jgi:KDO2-lipid IV(A) lauroyltransferase
MERLLALIGVLKPKFPPSPAIRRMDKNGAELKHGILKSVVSRIPGRYFARAGGWMGAGGYYLAGARRRLVLNNLRLAFPERSEADLKRLARSVYRNAAMTLMDTLLIPITTPGALLGRLKGVEGEAYIRRELSSGRGLVIASAHLGSWEFGLHAFNFYFERPITGIAKRLRNPLINDWIHKIRTHSGNRIIYKKGALQEMTQTLREGGVLSMMIDMSRAKDGVEVEFFGRRATATPAAVLLALRCRCPLMQAFIFRESDGDFKARIDPPLELSRTGDLRRDLLANTQKITTRVEEEVRRHPEQWNWFLKRWKDFHPHLYREMETRRQKRREKTRRARKAV